jgi:prefoldin subunit 5
MEYAKPSKEQVLEMLERRKQRLAAVLEHINMEIDKLKETKEEEKEEKT